MANEESQAGAPAPQLEIAGTIVPKDWDASRIREALAELAVFAANDAWGRPKSAVMEMLVRRADVDWRRIQREDDGADLLSNPRHMERTLRNQGEKRQIAKVYKLGAELAAELKTRLAALEKGEAER